MKIPYVVGEEYNRRQDLHDRFGGNRQGGMCKSADYPLMFIFTGPGGEQHGYSDEFMGNGLFFYTGEGQLQDMSFTRGNKALRNHVEDGRHVLLFEQSRKGFCRYRGEFSYVGHHYAIRTDREGNDRKAIIFELAAEPLEVVQALPLEEENVSVSNLKISTKLSLDELRQVAESGSSATVKSISVKSRIYLRSQAVKRYALTRANGVCECCKQPAPFLTKRKEPYLEVHHLNRVSDGGPDMPGAVAAICPTCHKNIHFGLGGKHINSRLATEIYCKEESLKL